MAHGEEKAIELQDLAPFFVASGPAPLTTGMLTIGINGNGERVGRGRGGGFGSWTNNSWGTNYRIDNFQRYTPSGGASQYLAEHLGGPPVVGRFVLTLGAMTQTWTNPTGGGGSKFYSVTGDEILVAANVGSIVTVQFWET